MAKRRRRYKELHAENEQLHAENTALRNALAPFAELANAADLAWLAGEDGVLIGIGQRWVTVADLRVAKAALDASEARMKQNDEKARRGIAESSKRSDAADFQEKQLELFEDF
jgi:hypothetical protein